ncbi:MAG: phospholipase A [Campylobacter sp.]|nr:phospholipase A [Campylobacter sp.]
MKFRLLTLLSLSVILGFCADEYYQKALEFEKNGDIKNAMKFYKLAYEKTKQADLPKTRQEPLQDEFLAKNDVDAFSFNQTCQIDESPTNSCKINDESLNSFAKENEKSSFFAKNKDTSHEQNIQKSEETQGDFFGIKTYELNYFQPITYTKNPPDKTRKKAETKFEFSAQKEIINNFFGFGEAVSVAYSQTSWWQTLKESSPFRESNYRPEIFITAPINFGYEPLRYLKFGLIHESNGRDGENSRSWNRFYFVANFQEGKLSIMPRIWTRVGDLSDNKNIRSYIGNADIKLKYRYGKHGFEGMFRSNLHLDKTQRGAVQFGYLYEMFSGVNLYLSYFNGYGESLIDYNRHTSKVGLGIAIEK